LYKGRAESEMCLPYTIERLRSAVRKLAATQEALVNSEKLASMGQLAAGIAHEVNNPLGIVLMYAHLMLEECATDTRERDDLQMIVEHADRCKKIVAGLLHFARQNKVEHRLTDLVELVSRMVKTLTPPLTIEIDVRNAMTDPMAEVDADQIVQVLTNLANNAFAAMEKCGSGKLTIELLDSPERVTFKVTDTGAGIAEENLKKVFDPFFTTKEAGKGTGLGLAVTYGIVKMHQGDIQVSSDTNPGEPPTGATFTITLPRIKPAEKVKEPVEELDLS
ncbi:HAMP domain-containing histidine kinase, partial [bacterium]|nr:HAMP domain-containing histidine kinase [bacterium]